MWMIILYILAAIGGFVALFFIGCGLAFGLFVLEDLINGGFNT